MTMTTRMMNQSGLEDGDSSSSRRTSRQRSQRRRRWLRATSAMVFLSTAAVSSLAALPHSAQAFSPGADNLRLTKPLTNDKAAERRRNRSSSAPTTEQHYASGLGVSAMMDSPAIKATASSRYRSPASSSSSSSLPPDITFSLTDDQEGRRLRQSISRKVLKQELISLPSTVTVSPTTDSSSSRGKASVSSTSSASAASLRKRRINSKMVRPKGLVQSRKLEVAAQKSRLLSRDEENQLSESIRALQYVTKVRKELSEMMQTEDLPEKVLAQACDLTVIQLRRAQYDGREARASLVSANAGLVISLAKRYHKGLKQALEAGGGVGTILSFQDMIQEGNMGLMQAAERYDPSRGLRFSTYATYWIRQKILRSISDYSRIIRLPAHVHSSLSKIHKARKRMTEEIGRVPSDPELAHYLEMSVDKLREFTNKNRNVISLERPVRTGGGLKDDSRTIGDFIVSDAPTPEEDALRQYLKDDIKIVVDTLPEPERKVLILRFGLERGESMTINDTAEQLQMTSDRVRSLEAKALNKLRNPQRNYRLKDYVGIERVEDEEEPLIGGVDGKMHPPASDNLWFF